MTLLDEIKCLIFGIGFAAVALLLIWIFTLVPQSAEEPAGMLLVALALWPAVAFGIAERWL